MESKSIALKSVSEQSSTQMTGGHKICLDSQGAREGKAKCEHSHREFLCTFTQVDVLNRWHTEEFPFNDSEFQTCWPSFTSKICDQCPQRAQEETACCDWPENCIFLCILKKNIRVNHLYKLVNVPLNLAYNSRSFEKIYTHFLKICTVNTVKSVICCEALNRLCVFLFYPW